EDDKGILRTKSGFAFLWQTEISLMFSQEGRRAVHLLIFAPNSKITDKITEYLGSKGRLDYDGRPIFGMSCPEFVELLKEIDDSIEIIPAHCMTSWMGLYGSKSGFDSLKECFKDKVNKIYAVESGLSANPPMLWRLKENVNIVSFSDSHSMWPWRLGREANVFDIDLTYDNLIKAIRTGKGLSYTIEVDPNYGKYHVDGHRACNVCMEPKDSKKLNKICPKCKKPLTIGVLHRVEELADREEGFKPKNAIPFKSLIPLSEILSFLLNTSVATKKIWQEYYNLINNFESEFYVLLEAKKEDLVKHTDEKIADAIIKVRQGKVKIKPGYDGVYGQLIFDEIIEEKENK
ncbi:MAG: DNA helicase UvrD, partial [Candidatus Dadabacteria bacterium]|nr:DNA helicase UvrD [Candidatus Dadabacteria bacterium]